MDILTYNNFFHEISRFLKKKKEIFRPIDKKINYHRYYLNFSTWSYKTC